MTNSLILVCEKHKAACTLMDEDGQNYDKEISGLFIIRHSHCHPVLVSEDVISLEQWGWVDVYRAEVEKWLAEQEKG